MHGRGRANDNINEIVGKFKVGVELIEDEGDYGRRGWICSGNAWEVTPILGHRKECISVV